MFYKSRFRGRLTNLISENVSPIAKPAKRSVPATTKRFHHTSQSRHPHPTTAKRLIQGCRPSTISHQPERVWNVHEGGWQLVRMETGKFMTIPATVTIGPPARGPD